ncbi:hypothetical protein Lal_00043222 [Lupinus albus]|nr:hypothetical protein Lal_00043222 [Lupinus albus]
MTRGNTGHLHPINPEIDRTYHRSIIDAASGGALGDMTPFEARGLIEKMASNSQQFNARSSDAIIVRGVHDVGTDSVRQEKLERKIDSLTTLVTQLAMNQQKQPMARVCGICTSPDHYSDVCPSLLEPRTTDHPEAYAANIYNNRPNQQQQNYDPSSSRYNPAQGIEGINPHDQQHEEMSTCSKYSNFKGNSIAILEYRLGLNKEARDKALNHYGKTVGLGQTNANVHIHLACV